MQALSNPAVGKRECKKAQVWRTGFSRLSIGEADRRFRFVSYGYETGRQNSPMFSPSPYLAKGRQAGSFRLYLLGVPATVFRLASLWQEAVHQNRRVSLECAPLDQVCQAENVRNDVQRLGLPPALRDAGAHALRPGPAGPFRPRPLHCGQDVSMQGGGRGACLPPPVPLPPPCLPFGARPALKRLVFLPCCCYAFRIDETGRALSAGRGGTRLKARPLPGTGAQGGIG